MNYISEMEAFDSLPKEYRMLLDASPCRIAASKINPVTISLEELQHMLTSLKQEAIIFTYGETHPEVTQNNA